MPFRKTYGGKPDHHRFHISPYQSKYLLVHRYIKDGCRASFIDSKRTMVSSTVSYSKLVHGRVQDLYYFTTGITMLLYVHRENDDDDDDDDDAAIVAPAA